MPPTPTRLEELSMPDQPTSGSEARFCPKHGLRPSWASGDRCQHDEGPGPCNLATTRGETAEAKRPGRRGYAGAFEGGEYDWPHGMACANGRAGDLWGV